MNYEVIDSDDYGKSGIETMFFPGGEPHIKVNRDLKKEEVLAFLKLRNWNDVGITSLFIDCALGAALFIPYFPGARQDKHERDVPCTVRVMARLLRPNDFSQWIHVFDPHSDEVAAELDDTLTDCKIWMPSDLDVPIKEDVVGIIAPDEGATARAENFRDKFYPKVELYHCSKKRDPKSGALSGYVMPELELSGRYIVVDDICDGGGTFNLLAEEFCTQALAGKMKLELFVSHGIFSKGLVNIHPVYEHITTTDSWCTHENLEGWVKHDPKRITILPLNQLFDRIMSNE